MSMFTNVGNYAHNALLTGAGMGAMSHISAGVGIGAGLGAVNALVTGNDTMIGGAISGAATGGLLGAGTRFGSMKYAAGMNSFINSTTDITGKVFAGTKASTIQDVSNFKFGHFTRSDAQNTHANYWHPDSTNLKGTRFQHYDPRYTPAMNPTNQVSTGVNQIDQYTKEFI